MTIPHQIEAEILTRQQLLVRSGLDILIDHRVAGLIRGDRRDERLLIRYTPHRRAGHRVVETVEFGFGQVRAVVVEHLADVAGLEVGELGVPVHAPRDGDGAYPCFVRGGAVVAIAGEGVAGCGGGVALYLLEGKGEVGVETGGV